MIDPTVVDLPDRRYIEIVPAEPAFFLDEDQAGPFKHSQVLHDGASVEFSFEMRAQIASGFRFITQEIENLSTAAVRESLVNEIVIFFS